MAQIQRKPRIGGEPVRAYRQSEPPKASPYRLSEEEPMSEIQASYLMTLCEEADEPGAFDRGLSRRAAARRIDTLKDKLGLLDPPPHTD